MHRQERIGESEEMLRMTLDGAQSRLWTALPGIISSFDPHKMTCEVRPAILGSYRAPDGTISPVTMPLLLDCPVLWQGGGGVTLTFPIKPGDECLVVFASRCISAWWSQGGVQEPEVFRMHDLSDGFVLAGVRSVPRAFDVSTTAAQLRTDDGAAYVEINPTSKKITAHTSGDIEATAGGNIAMTAAGQIALNAPNIVLNGQVTQGKGSNGGACSMQGPLAVVEDVTAGGISLIHHTHPDPQGGSTSEPS